MNPKLLVSGDDISSGVLTSAESVDQPNYLQPSSGGLHRQESYESIDSNVGLSEHEISAKMTLKRIKISEEIVETEKSFLSDMHVLVEVFFI